MVAEGSPTPQLHPTLVIWRWGRSRIPGRGWTAVPQLALSPLASCLADEGAEGAGGPPLYACWRAAC